jgi:hypothetical protein
MWSNKPALDFPRQKSASNHFAPSMAAQKFGNSKPAPARSICTSRIPQVAPENLDHQSVNQASFLSKLTTGERDHIVSTFGGLHSHRESGTAR